MTPHNLKKWCAKHRGRATKLAAYLDCSREFIRQMSVGGRPIPVGMHTHIPAAMARVEADEAKAIAEGLDRINAMGWRP